MKNEIKFICRNNVYHENEPRSLNDIFLSGNNPRFTLMNSFRENLTVFIADNTFSSKQEKIFNKLIYSEGDLSDLKRLLKNIEEYGFDNSQEPIFLVFDEFHSKFVVAEGNRRVMCLKMIFTDDYPLPSLKDFNMHYNEYEDENTKKIDDNVFDEDEECADHIFKKNYDEVKKSITNLKAMCKQYDFHFEIISDSKGLWRAIYDKHLTGERPGMRKWSRSKYFADLLNVFKDGIIQGDKRNIEIFKNINRESDVVKSDFKTAQLIYAFFYFANTPNSEDDIIESFNDKDILHDMITSRNISALEQLHSYNKIKTLMCDRILLISKDEFSKKIAKISYKKENARIVLESYKLSLKKLLIYIYDIWKKRILTTRPIKKEYEQQVIVDLKLLLSNIDIDNKLSEAEIDKLDEFELTLSQLQKIISVQNEYHNKETMNRFIAARNIKEIDNNISKMVDDKVSQIDLEDFKNSPLYVFKNIKDQLVHNSGSKTYLNAIFISIRSFFEQIVIWSEYVGEPDLFLSQNIHVLCDEKTHKQFARIRNRITARESNMNDFITKVIINGYNNKKYQHIKKEFTSLMEENKWNDVINENIHSAHRVYTKSLYNKFLTEFEEFARFVNIFFEQIDFRKFKKISDAIEGYIHANH